MLQSAGCGLAHRLLSLADSAAAAGPHSLDPIYPASAASLPHPPSHPPSLLGSCSEAAWLQRVRVAQEALTLLRVIITSCDPYRECPLVQSQKPPLPRQPVPQFMWQSPYAVHHSARKTGSCSCMLACLRPPYATHPISPAPTNQCSAAFTHLPHFVPAGPL